MLIIIILMSFVWMFFQYCTMHYSPASWVVMFSCMDIQSRGTPTFLCIIFNHYLAYNQGIVSMYHNHKFNTHITILSLCMRCPGKHNTGCPPAFAKRNTGKYFKRPAKILRVLKRFGDNLTAAWAQTLQFYVSDGTQYCKTSAGARMTGVVAKNLFFKYIYN